MKQPGAFFQGPNQPSRRQSAVGYGRASLASARDPNILLTAGTAGASFVVQDAWIAGYGAAVLTTHMGTLVASGTEHAPNTFNGAVGFSLSAYGGATAKLAMSSPTLIATGTGTIVGRANLAMSMPTLAASGYGGALGSAELTLATPFAMSGFSGALVSLTLHDGYTINMLGTAGAAGRATITMPLYELTATGHANDTGSAHLTMPMLRPVPSGVMRLALPGYVLEAAGHAVVAATYEAYAVNLLDGLDRNPQNQYDAKVSQVTHYTNYPFNQIVRYNGEYYGAAADGLYLLGGDLDVSAPIAWVFRTALTDFGSKQFKRVKSIYIGGRLVSQATATLVVGEAQELAYTYTTLRGGDAQNYRVKFGKGVRTRYVAIELSDVDGNFIEIDSLDLENETLGRAI